MQNMDFRPEPSFYFDGGDLFYVELSIISFRNYISLVEKSFAEQQKIISEKYREHYKKLNDPEQYDSLLHTTSSELYEIEQEFIQRFRNSILIQLFSFLENELKSICNTHSESTKSIYSVNELKGNSDLEKIKKYMTKSMTIEIAKFDLWTFINNLRILRNKIVHENSTIQINDGDLNSMKSFSKDKFLLNSQNPNPEFYNIVFNNREFIDECLNKTESFIQEIMKDYRPVY